MKMAIETKTYGIRSGMKKNKARYFITCDGWESDLNYSNIGTAMRKSLAFCKASYKDFYRYEDQTQVHFVYKEMHMA